MKNPNRYFNSFKTEAKTHKYFLNVKKNNKFAFKFEQDINVHTVPIRQNSRK